MLGGRPRFGRDSAVRFEDVSTACRALRRSWFRVDADARVFGGRPRFGRCVWSGFEDLSVPGSWVDDHVSVEASELVLTMSVQGCWVEARVSVVASELVLSQDNVGPPKLVLSELC